VVLVVVSFSVRSISISKTIDLIDFRLETFPDWGVS
jgi:hypothetical protein